MTYKILFHKYMKHGSQLSTHDRTATLNAIKLLAKAQGLDCEVRVLGEPGGDLIWADALVLPYPDAQTPESATKQAAALATAAAERGIPLINLLTDVDERFANARAGADSPLLAKYSHVWFTQANEAVARATFEQASVDWADAVWSHFPQTQLGFAEALALGSASAPPKNSFLYDCVYYGIHKSSRAVRLRRYFDDERFASACYGSQISGADTRHVDTELRLTVDAVLSFLLPCSMFSLYVTCPGHYNSACFRLVEAALAGRACLIDVESAAAGSFGLDAVFTISSSKELAELVAAGNKDSSFLTLLYTLYLTNLRIWSKALPSNCADLRQLAAS